MKHTTELSGSLAGLDLGNPEVSNQSNVLDIEVPDQMNEVISTGMPHVDALFAGDGMVPGTVTMFTGLPGTGKTTFAIQLADSCTKEGHLAVYTGLEESLYQTRRTVSRLGCKHGFVPDYTADVQTLLARVDSISALKENKGKKVVLVVDSLPCLTVKSGASTKRPRGRPLSGEKMVEEALKHIVAWAKRTWSCVLVLNHTTKGGKFAGKNLLKHLVDAHLHASWDRNRKSDTHGERIMEMEKNRFGTAGLFYPFKLRANGLVFEGETGYDDTAV